MGLLGDSAAWSGARHELSSDEHALERTSTTLVHALAVFVVRRNVA
ncbi:MAG TPA: hypothetical protein VES67_25620 [Vicinamibacterales bacterium]|nr:hypothetical protein [Vicinamibacterales bacterium]